MESLSKKQRDKIGDSLQKLATVVESKKPPGQVTAWTYLAKAGALAPTLCPFFLLESLLSGPRRD